MLINKLGGIKGKAFTLHIVYKYKYESSCLLKRPDRTKSINTTKDLPKMNIRKARINLQTILVVIFKKTSLELWYFIQTEKSYIQWL